MPKKAELESAYIRYASLCRQAAEAEVLHDYSTALRLAELGLSHQSLALAFQRKFLEADRPAVMAIDRILRLAPPLFARRSLDAVDAYAASRKKTERSLTPKLLEQLRTARERLAQAVRLWSDQFCTSSPSSPLKPDDLAASFIGIWVGMGLVAAKGSGIEKRLVLVTDLRRDCWASCSNCGIKQRAPALDYLDPTNCSSCGRQGMFVISQRII